MTRHITCINCPMGCQMDVELENDVVLSVKGNICKRGENYARQECVQPMRMVTAVVAVEGSNEPLSVKTASPIPKERISDCMQAISRARVKLPVRAGDTVVENVCDTGVNVIATRDL